MCVFSIFFLVACSDLSSRRQQEQQQEDGGSSIEPENHVITAGARRANQNTGPVSNPTTASNSPPSTVRSHDLSSSAIPRPSANQSRPPPSELTSLSGDSGAGPSSLVYLNFDHEESEDGLSSFSNPRTIIREEPVARIRVDNTTRETARVETSEVQNSASRDTEGIPGLSENQQQSESQDSSENRPRQQESGSDAPESRSRPQEESGSSNAESRSQEQNRGRTRRAREGITRDNSSDNLERQRNNSGGGDRPRRENSSGRRPTTPAPDYTMGQPPGGRNRSRRGQQQQQEEDPRTTELPPPYQTHDPSLPMRILRSQNEAQQAYAHAQQQVMEAHAQHVMRQRSRGWYSPDPRMAPMMGANPYFGPAPFI